MSLFYVTGTPGVGKSQVLKELQARGFEAHGTDEHEFAKWVNKETGKIDQLPENDPNFEIHKWFADHEWILDEDKIEKLKEQSDASDKPVFLCGVASGEDVVWDKFSGVFALFADEGTIRQRIDERKNNDFGKKPEEMERILALHQGYEEKYAGFGATLIDATQSVPKVVDDIIADLPPAA